MLSSLRFLRIIKKNPDRRAFCTALVPAAGNSSRMGANAENKLLMDLDGAPVLARTLTALQLSRRVDEIVIAAREQDLEPVSRICADYHIKKCENIIVGGETRAESVLRAAMAASRNAAFFAVHDGARPLITPDLIDRTIEAAIKYGAAAPAIPMKDTIKKIRKNENPDQKQGNQNNNNIQSVSGTLNRDLLRAIQTPQAFDADLLKAALQSAAKNKISITDDCSAVEKLGKTVYLIPGDEENIKLTTPLDFIFARAILEKRKNPEAYI